MEFDVETDPETLFELFGEDAESFAEYVSAIPRKHHPDLKYFQRSCLGLRSRATSRC